jgi:hypothetical protein
LIGVAAVAVVGWPLGGCQAGADVVGADPAEVTAEQYRQAVEDTRDCLDEQGFQVSDVGEGSAGVLLSFTWESAEGAPEAYGSCYEEHLKVIEHHWFHSNVPSGSERDAMVGEFRECLAGVGVNVSAVPLTDDLAELLVAIQEQIDDESEEFADVLLCIDDYRLLYPEGVLPL